jgi:hypothetical protein
MPRQRPAGRPPGLTARLPTRAARKAMAKRCGRQKQKQMDIDGDMEQLADLDRRWNAAYAENRRQDLAAVLADDFVASTADGRVVTKSHLMCVDEPATADVRAFAPAWVGATIGSYCASRPLARGCISWRRPLRTLSPGNRRRPQKGHAWPPIGPQSAPELPGPPPSAPEHSAPPTQPQRPIEAPNAEPHNPRRRLKPSSDAQILRGCAKSSLPRMAV